LHAGRDFLRAEPGFAWKEMRAGVYRGLAQSAAIPAIITFIIEYADKLKVFVGQAFHDPTLVNLIDEIVRALAVASTTGI
jgi:hypothetical protein